MQKLDLESLVRCGFSHTQIAELIFKQLTFPVSLDESPLTDDEHAFLLTHLRRWEVGILEAWIASHPRADNARILQRFLELALSTGTIWLITPPGGWRSEDFEELVDQWRKKEPGGLWRCWLPRLTGFCPLFHELVRLETGTELPEVGATLARWSIDAPLAARLWPWRRDAREFEARLVALTRPRSSDDLAPSAPDAEAFGPGTAEHLYALACVEHLGLLGRIEDPRSVFPTSTVWPTSSSRYTVLGSGEIQFEDGEEFRSDWLRRLALRWPGAPGAVARGWLHDEALRAAREGTPWHLIWAFLPDGALRTELGVTVADGISGPPALFSAWALAEKIRPGELFPWALAFRWLELAHAAGWLPDENRRETLRYRPLSAHLGRRVDAGLLPEVDVSPHIQRILLDAPLPPGPDEQFAQRFLELVDLCRDPLMGDLWGWPPELLARVVRLPIPGKTARKILEEMLPGRTPGELETIRHLASLAGALSPEEFPPERLGWEGDLVEVYRVIVGERADQSIRDWLLRDDHPRFGLLRSHPELLDDEVRERMRARAQTSFSTARWFNELVPGLLDEHELAAIALRSSGGQDWQLEFEDYPTSCREVMQDRFVRALCGHDDRLVDGVARWLRRQGLDSTTLRGLFLDHPEAWDGHAGRRWFAREFSFRTAWDDHGQPVVRRALDAGKPQLLLTICRELCQEVADQGAAKKVPLAAIHEAMARVLIERVGRAMTEGDAPSAARFLRALFCLHPRSGVSSAMPRLRRHEADGEVGELLRVCRKHLERSDSRMASVGDIRAAILELRPEPEGQPSLAEGTLA